jgi:glycosyltransferase involved in cell wall biosynthesis
MKSTTDRKKMENNLFSVIIPAYNEAESIGALISSIKSMHPAMEIIVVDDGSTDETGRVSEQVGARVIRHPYNIGNGAAVKTGIRHAKGDVLILMDGDGQHSPEIISEMIDYIPKYDMVVGARSGNFQQSFIRNIGNGIFNQLASYVAKFSIKDLTSGFRVIKANIARRFLYLIPNTYSYPTTLTLCLLRSGHTLKYITIQARTRKTGRSEIRIAKDGIRFFMIIVKICVLYSPFRIFLPISFFTFMAGLLWYMYTLLAWGRFTNMSALLFSTSVLIFMIGLVSEQINQIWFDKSENPTHGFSDKS